MLHLHFANRFERLSDQLLARLGAGRGGVFEVDTVIVPSAAVRRILTLALADAHAICAQVQFDFLAAWLWQQLGQVLRPADGPAAPGVPPKTSPEALLLAPRHSPWRIYSQLLDADFVASHARLAHYLNHADDVMRLELAQSVASLFDQYQSYRADWLQSWHAGGVVATLPGVGVGSAAAADQVWQIALWRRLQAPRGAGPQGLDPLAAFVAALAPWAQQGRTQPGAPTPDPTPGPAPAHWQLPRQLHVFALPTMAPLHIQLLQALGRVVDIHVYVLNPCQEHWFELIDRRRLAHLARSGRDQGFEVGNRLLAAWGRQTQSHVDLLVDSCGLDAEDDAEFEPHPGSSLLAQLHNAVLELTELAPGSLQLAPDDRSIELQVCHSLTRELEVLHNHLLGLFVQAEEGHGAPLAPSQVLVVVPDLVAAAPLIDAIFGTVPRQRRIAYTVSGRPRSTVNSAARALLALLGLMASRCNAADVFSLLQLPLVARRFGLDEVALQQIHTWLLASGFHWALDGPHSAGLGVASDGRHTLAQAVARLFLGYASPALVEAPLQVSLNADLGTDLLPAGNAQGLAALPLGALWQFSQHLQALQQTCSQAHTPAVWAERLHQVLQDFMLAEGDELSDLRELRDVITALAEEQQSGAPEQPLSLAVMRAALQHSLDDPARGGVPTGQVTFSSISSLRSLPFEVVCVIGLNDGAFPTTPRPHEFDLMALAPRRGDRQRRSDERNLFLDLLLAARRSLYLSHSGRSVFDNAPLPPSVLVSELLDVLLPAIATDPASAASLARARQRLVVEHPLQPFSLQAFARDGDPRLRSFDGPLCAALQHGLRSAPLVEPRRVAPTRRLEINFGSHVDTDPDSDDEPPAAEPLAAFFSAPLAAPGPAWRSVSLQQLQAFFRNPCRSLLRQRLGISLLREPDTLQDDEPFLPDWAGRQSLQQRVLPALLAGASDQAVARLARAGPEQPGGDLGAQQLQAELRALRDFANQVQAACAAPVLPTHHVELSFDLDGETWTLQNSYSALRADGQTIWKFDNTRAADYVQSWLAHLLLCAAPAPGVLAQTAGLSRDGHFQFSPCGPAYALLHELLGLYRQGLCQPLHFFPKSSWVYIRSNHNLDKAAATWRTSSARPYAESADPAYQLAFRGQSEPLDAAFQALAQTVFNPLLQHLHDSRVLN